MSALTNVHATLRPRGLLLDVRPAATNSSVALYRGDPPLLLGYLDESDHAQRVAIADAAIETVVDAHLFVCERERSFQVLYHFPSADAWLDYMCERWQNAVIPERIIARARKLMSGGAGELRISRDMYAGGFRRM